METVTLDGETIKFKKDSLHKMLAVPEDRNIGLGNMRKIAKAKIGDKVTISTSTRKNKVYKVTKLMKRRAQFGLNLQGKG
jgi:hypothetical protein